MTRAQLDQLQQALRRIERAVLARDERDGEALRQVQELAARLDPTPPDDARARE